MASLRFRKYYALWFSRKTFTWFDWLLIGSSILLSIISAIQAGSLNWVASGSIICGVFCVVLGAKGSMANWLFGIVEVFFYAYICFSGHIYADGLQRLFYNLPMQFLGIYWWSQRRRTNDNSRIKTRFLSWGQRFFFVFLIVLATWGVAQFIKSFQGVMPEFLSTYILPGKFVKQDYTTMSQLYMDACTTVVSLVATYISAKAYVEQWFLWLFINVLSIFVWMQNIGVGDPNAFLMASKYALYLVNSIYAIIVWIRLSKEDPISSKRTTGVK